MGAGKGRWCPRGRTRGDGAHGAVVSTGQARGAGAALRKKAGKVKRQKNICIGGSARNARWGLGGIYFKDSVGFFLFTPPS